MHDLGENFERLQPNVGLAGEFEDIDCGYIFISEVCLLYYSQGVGDDLQLLLIATPWSIPAVVQIPLAIHNLL